MATSDVGQVGGQVSILEVSTSAWASPGEPPSPDELLLLGFSALRLLVPGVSVSPGGQQEHWPVCFLSVGLLLYFPVKTCRVDPIWASEEIQLNRTNAKGCDLSCFRCLFHQSLWGNINKHGNAPPWTNLRPGRNDPGEQHQRLSSMSGRLKPFIFFFSNPFRCLQLGQRSWQDRTHQEPKFTDPGF